jgi:hypothetical protein
MVRDSTRRIEAVTRRVPISYDLLRHPRNSMGNHHLLPNPSLPIELTTLSLHTCVESWRLLVHLPLLKICKPCCGAISK